jgi:Zn-dependent protease with chaperone function
MPRPSSLVTWQGRKTEEYRVKTIGTVSLLCCLLFLFSAAGQGAASPPSSPAAQATPASAPSAPTTAYTLPPDKFEKAKALYALRVRMLIVGTVWSLVVVLGILYLGVVARYRDWAERFSKYSFFQAWIVVPLFLLTTSLLNLPLDAYQHSISRQYGLSVQGWGSWFGDAGKGFLVAAILGTILLWLMIVIIRKSPRRWWFYFWLIAQPILVLAFIAEPLIIDPLFFKFEPLDKNNPQLVDAIERVTQRGGLEIPRERMFLMKASEKTNELNAYVTGFGPSKRVVVWDTTIQKTTIPETLFVFGHEMGHYVLNHVIYGLLLTSAGMFAALYLIYRVSSWMLRRFGARWRIRELGDWAALPMIFLILGIFGFFSSPIFNSISRQTEHNADIYGLEVTHGINANPQEAGAHAFQVLGEISLDYPYPSRLLTFWYGSHPSISDRVRFAHEYDPWSKGEQPKYVK